MELMETIFCKPRPNNPITLTILLIVVFFTGCTTELSTIDGLSIKKAFHQWGGHGPASQGGFGYWDSNLQDILQNKNRTKRLVSSVDLSGRYDFVFSAELHNEVISLQTESLEQIFGISIEQEIREIPVLILTHIKSSSLKLTPSRSKNQPEVRTLPSHMCWHFYRIGDLLKIFQPYEPTTHTFQNYTTSDLVYWLEKYQKVVVVDETNLQGMFDFRLTEDSKKGVTLIDSLKRLGFELKQGRRPIAAIYIDKLSNVKPTIPLKELGQQYQVYPAWKQP